MESKQQQPATDEPRNNHATLWAALAAFAIFGGIAIVVGVSLKGESALEYFKDVHQVLPEAKKWKGKRLRLHGNVVKGTIVKRKGKLDYRFGIASKGSFIDVSYRGVVPDSFKDCAEVVVKGRFSNTTHFKADSITAKCPSKYDEKKRLTGCSETLTQRVISTRAASTSNH